MVVPSGGAHGERCTELHFVGNKPSCKVALRTPEEPSKEVTPYYLTVSSVCLSVCLSVEVEVGLTCTVRAAERLHDTQGPIRADSV